MQNYSATEQLPQFQVQMLPNFGPVPTGQTMFLQPSPQHQPPQQAAAPAFVPMYTTGPQGSLGTAGVSGVTSMGYNSTGSDVNNGSSAHSGRANVQTLGYALSLGDVPGYPAKERKQQQQPQPGPQQVLLQAPQQQIIQLQPGQALPPGAMMIQQPQQPQQAPTQQLILQQQQQQQQILVHPQQLFQQLPPPPPPAAPKPSAPVRLNAQGKPIKKVAMMHADVLPIPDPNDEGPKQLIVNYIAAQVKISELFALFSQFGKLECAKILLDQEGNTKGFGFVYFGHSDDAATALKELQSFELYGKYLRIGFAVPQRSPPVKE